MQTARAMACGAAVMVVGLGAAAAAALAGRGIGLLSGTLLLCGIGQGIVAPPLIGTILERVAALVLAVVTGLAAVRPAQPLVGDVPEAGARAAA
jgi:hypothetical protein